MGNVDSNLLKAFSNLTDREHRQANSVKLANLIGADEIIIFIYDVSVQAYLPGLGFRQTYPDGKRLKDFLEACSELGNFQSPLRLIDKSKEPQNVIGIRTSDNSILAVVGGNPSHEKLMGLSQLLPLLAFAYNSERSLQSMKVQIEVLKKSAAESKAYAKVVNESRKQVEKALLELRQSEAKVRAFAESSQKSLENLQRERVLREQFVATLTHDLRSPLAAAKMSAQMIVRKSDLGENAHRLLGRILSNIDRVDQMIQDLLDANLIREGETLPLKFEECDLREIVNDSIEDLITVHGDRFILLGEGEFKGVWSCSALRRVVENLAVNGIKYGDLYTPVTISLSRFENDCFEIAVHNEGKVISSEDQKILFEPYRRTSSARLGQNKGWGLGLTLVKGIIDAHHGKIKVESGPGLGTTFSIQLPSDSSIKSLNSNRVESK
ncbi:MAG TPA: HAMP domain-containing sensor histidine kinase [Bacteriovoracaceae bacterium]|nr:HAMP domain-containing sensor histidine kinase [Bacteriovoracaceae bacterium]